MKKPLSFCCQAPPAPKAYEGGGHLVCSKCEREFQTLEEMEAASHTQEITDDLFND